MILDADVKGDAYEGLLEKNAQDTKTGAGQYFTPRALIQAIVDVMHPKPGETICDPACGTGGFLLAAHDYVATHYPNLDREEKRFLRLSTLHGVEIVDGVTRLCAMNLLLHGIGPTAEEADPPVATDDSLRSQAGKPRSGCVNAPDASWREANTPMGSRWLLPVSWRALCGPLPERCRAHRKTPKRKRI